MCSFFFLNNCQVTSQQGTAVATDHPRDDVLSGDMADIQTTVED